jgi:hypothetical protein
LTVLFAWMYRVLRGLGLGSDDDEFAPAATWPPAERPTQAAVTLRHATLASACIVAGLAWFVAGMLAMHVFNTLPHIDSVPADIAFHGSGLWLATIGLALRFLPHPTLRTS